MKPSTKTKEVVFRGRKILKEIMKNIPRKKYYLTQKDFSHGSFRITKPGRYILKENIAFSPNPLNDYRPIPSDSRYSSKAYSLGFFAAIVIEVDGVEIDLNGKTLKQSDEMTWMQRFYANIETASAPFIPSQGPGDFGKNISSPKYIYIHNGTLGRSSHHAIHGNGNEYVYIENVKMVDYEFVGAALNGGKYVVYHNCVIDHNFKDLKVLASWSAAIFLKQFADTINNKLETMKVSASNMRLIKDFQAKRIKLTNSITKTKKELFDGSDISNPLYRNPSKLPDGNVFGIVNHPLGVAIHDFTSKSDMSGKEVSSHLYIENCTIKDLEANVDEVIGLVNKDNKVQKGPAGDLMKIEECMDINHRYKGNEISDMIIVLSKLKRAYPSLGYGTLHVDKDVEMWSDGKARFSDLQKKGYKFLTGQDSMGHTNKGAIAIRIDGTDYVRLTHNTISNVINYARLGSTKNSSSKVYKGTLCSGVHMSMSKNVKIERVLVDNVLSYNGEACGVKAINHCDVDISHSRIKDIMCGHKYIDGKWSGSDHNKTFILYNTTSPNEIPSSRGLCWTHNSKVVKKNVDINSLSGPQTFYIAVI